MMNSQFQIKNNFNGGNPNIQNITNNHFPYINQKYTNDSKAHTKDSPPPPVTRIYKKSGSKVRQKILKNYFF